MWSNQKQTENLIILGWMVELVFVAKNWDDFWLVVKGKSNTDIACSLRNFFKKVV